MLNSSSRRAGPTQIGGGQLGVPASTVHAVLTRCRINRLSYIDRITGEPLRRYEHDHPGSLIHVDVTKYANIPDGGGHEFVGRQLGERNAIQTARRTGERTSTYRPRIGIAFVHTVIDEHSRMAYAEICTDEKAVTAVAVLQRAVAWFADRGVAVERVHRTLADGWAHERFYESTEHRNAALSGWLHFYNHHRAHSAIGGRPPVTRPTNVPGHHT